MKTVCCVCHRTKSPDGWVESVESVAHHAVSHGYCPRCFHEVQKMLRSAGKQDPAPQTVPCYP